MKMNFTSLSIAREQHLTFNEEGKLEPNGFHLHCYLRDKDGRGIKAVNELIRAWLDTLRQPDDPTSVLGFDIQPCKNVKKWLSYISKEDPMPFSIGCDFGDFNWYAQVHAKACQGRYQYATGLTFKYSNRCNFLEKAWNEIYDAHTQFGQICPACGHVATEIDAMRAGSLNRVLTVDNETGQAITAFDLLSQFKC